jgi:hypothetical protein
MKIVVDVQIVPQENGKHGFKVDAGVDGFCTVQESKFIDFLFARIQEACRLFSRETGGEMVVDKTVVDKFTKIGNG